MPNPPRRLRSAGRLLWTSVHSRNRLTIHEGILLARACELADRVARLEKLISADHPDNASEALRSELDAARARLAASLREVGPVARGLVDDTPPSDQPWAVAVAGRRRN